MIESEYLRYLAPILVLIVAFIVMFFSLKKLKITGSDTTAAIFSAVISLIFVTSSNIVEYSVEIIPWLAVVSVILFFIMLTLALVAKDIEVFKKPLAGIGFAAAILIALCLLFDNFPTLYHLLPHTSDAYLNSPMEHFKDFIYSRNIFADILFVIVAIVVGVIMVKTK